MSNLNPRIVLSSLILAFIAMFCQHADAEPNQFATPQAEVKAGKFTLQAIVMTAKSSYRINAVTPMTKSLNKSITEDVFTSSTDLDTIYDAKAFTSSIGLAPMSGLKNHFQLESANLMSLATR